MQKVSYLGGINRGSPLEVSNVTMRQGLIEPSEPCWRRFQPCLSWVHWHSDKLEVLKLLCRTPPTPFVYVCGWAYAINLSRGDWGVGWWVNWQGSKLLASELTGKATMRCARMPVRKVTHKVHAHGCKNDHAHIWPFACRSNSSGLWPGCLLGVWVANLPWMPVASI